MFPNIMKIGQLVYQLLRTFEHVYQTVTVVIHENGVQCYLVIAEDHEDIVFAYA